MLKFSGDKRVRGCYCFNWKFSRTYFVRTAFLSFVAMGNVLCVCVGDAGAFPLWPKGKDEAVPIEKNEKTDKPVKAKQADKAEQADKAAAVQAKPAVKAAQTNAVSDEPALHIPADFVPSLKVNSGAAKSSITILNAPHDPMLFYRQSGITPVEERKIRQLAGEYEGAQRVRLKLLDNLLAEMRQFQFETEPDATAVLAKQDEINKLSALMANERVKLLLAIRDAMSHDEKVRLVEELERSAGLPITNHGGEAPEIKSEP